MAQINFYMTDYERIDLFCYICRQGGGLIPNLLYQTDSYNTVAHVEQFVNIQQNESVHFFIISPSFQIEPLIMSKNCFFEESIYSIYQRKGGPYIDISFYRGFADDAVVKYKCTNLDYYGRFIHYNNHDEFKATEELKAFYNLIVKYVKSISKNRLMPNGKRYLISHKAFEEMEQRE